MRALLGFGVILGGGIILGWNTREDIATNLIESQLRDMGLQASYEIVSIDPDRQVLKNLVIGDAAHPDLTIERLEVFPRYRFGVPAIGRIRIVSPRLRGTYMDGQLSFGALDKVIFAESDSEPGLPDLDLALVDGQAVITGDLGVIGVKAMGQGELDHGFAGMLGIAAPQLALGACGAHATLAGDISVSRGRPNFAGPMRIKQLSCGDGGMQLARLDADIDATGDADLAGVEGSAKLTGKQFSLSTSAANSMAGKGAFSWRDGRGKLRYELAASAVRTPYLRMGEASVSGAAQLRDAGAVMGVDATLTGKEIALGADADRQLEGLQTASRGTLLEPLLAKLRKGIRQAVPGSNFSAELDMSRKGDAFSLNVPDAQWRMANGNTMASLSRFQLAQQGYAISSLSGNFTTGGADIPSLRARMERGDGPDAIMQLEMAPYRAGTAELAIPALAISQRGSGALGFSGRIAASGALPGGQVRNLRLPVRGNWSAAQGLSLWRSCTDISFTILAISNLELDQRSVKLCPPRNGAIVRSGKTGFQFAAGIPSLDLSGRLAGTPIVLNAGPIGFGWPGKATARQINVALGADGEQNRFVISNLDSTLGSDIGGTFSEADVKLFALPLDIANAGGVWSLNDGVLRLQDGQFRLLDRTSPARFEPLEARGATLTLADSIITAQADLRHPGSDRVVTSADIVHNLSNSTGHANLAVNGLKFDDGLQPEDLSVLAKGVVALANGVINGTGRIDWNDAGVTSSGRVSSDNLDFAAAFGPVKGASGTVEFTDLLNLTTAPNQKIKIGSINPGIEVIDGELNFAVSDGQLVSLKGAEWPFMGGKLILRPVDLNIGANEERRYVIEIVGADAAQFVASMELGNLSASGLFDGTVPIVFDAQGNGRIEGGLLISRPPGGNLSYVGELTYEDLSPMGNFAFQSLRSLDFTQMQIEMDGPLTGEIVTKVRFDGVRQGAGAKSNFVTKRIAKLPLQFRVNIRAPFYQLITSLKSMYDPAFVRDPRELGLLSDDGTQFLRPSTGAVPAQKPESDTENEPAIQRQESESMP